MLLNEICGKKIINSNSARFLGVVVGGVVTRDLKEIKAFKIGVLETLDTGLREEKRVYIAPESIISFKDVLVTEGLLFIEKPGEDACMEAPLGAPIYNPCGTMYGYLMDIMFNKDFEVSKLVYDRPFGIKKIISVSGDAIVAQATAARKNASTDNAKCDSFIKTPTQGRGGLNLRRAVTGAEYAAGGVLPIREYPPEALALLEPEFQIPGFTSTIVGRGAYKGRDGELYAVRYPHRIIGDYSFLLGRTVGEDVKNIKNEIIIPKGAIISDKVVETAASHGKLVELTFSSIKN